MRHYLATWSIFALLALLVVAQPPVNEDEEPLNGPDGLRVFVGKKGGSIRVFRQLGESNGRNRTSGVVGVAFFKIAEVDASGNDIPGKHKVNNPGNVGFTVTRTNNKNIQPGGTQSDEILADCLTCIGSLRDVDDALMVLSVCVTKSNGTLVMDNEESTVLPGQLKFSVQLTNWTWADNGQFIDVEVNMKIPPGRAISRRNSNSTDGGRGRRRPAVFSLGADSSASFSAKVRTDDKWATMPDGYPQFANRGANNIITLRIPRFNSSAFYDPTVEVGAQTADDSPDSTGASSTLSRPIAWLLLAFIAIAKCMTTRF